MYLGLSHNNLLEYKNAKLWIESEETCDALIDKCV